MLTLFLIAVISFVFTTIVVKLFNFGMTANSTIVACIAGALCTVCASISIGLMALVIRNF